MHTRNAVSFDRERLEAFMDVLERVAAGDTQAKLAISPEHDELDAMAFGINVVADELRFAHARITASERVKAEELREALAHLGGVAMLDVLTGSLAHEIPQPLTAAMTNAAAALHLLPSSEAASSDPASELRDTLNDILSETKRAADVVERMRSLIRKSAT